MTREQLSRASGVREGAIARMEEGRLDPSFDLLLELAEGLGTRPSTLIIYAERLVIAEGVAPIDEQPR